MITRFERHVRRRAAGEMPRGAKRENLGVRFARFRVVSLADDDVAVRVDDDATDERVRVDVARRSRREFQRSTHVPAVDIGDFARR